MPPTSSFGWRGEAPTPLFDDSGEISRSPEVGTRASSSPDDDPDDGAALSDRPRWSSTSEFLLAAVGSAGRLGNLLRFPYVTYAHGGAAFLIPYGLAVVCLGVPVLWMEPASARCSSAASWTASRVYTRARGAWASPPPSPRFCWPRTTPPS